MHKAQENSIEEIELQSVAKSKDFMERDYDAEHRGVISE